MRREEQEDRAPWSTINPRRTEGAQRYVLAGACFERESSCCNKEDQVRHQNQVSEKAGFAQDLDNHPDALRQSDNRERQQHLEEQTTRCSWSRTVALEADKLLDEKAPRAIWLLETPEAEEKISQHSASPTLNVMLFLIQLALITPISTYRPLREPNQDERGYICTQGRPNLTTLEREHMNLVSSAVELYFPFVFSMLTHPSVELFIISSLAFGVLVTLTYRFNRFSGIQDAVFKAAVTLGVASSVLSNWTGTNGTTLAIPVGTSFGLLSGIMVRRIWK
ncbi:uncharacterized protein BDR25DRAFT_341650 [Lindgomyces ingoldianus]|uniref:Uncharacterized protein n=1 Tax=Lindgomyces ingoldianus TaxID=673940 RepID=A0ACB6R0J6_9PLEO|nr:uncharacterized protein BDR25DRAFT_341650 [Lindgomyces ingoldianus]KAF2472834.1 hypothetical protein BDR25DRAFT_341650 [Lindgomyces ingoldianus]